MSFVLSANRLTDGSVVYLTPASEWSNRIADAKVFSEGEREHALRSGQEAETNNLVVAYYEVAVTTTAPFQPNRLRERIRGYGPTVGQSGVSADDLHGVQSHAGAKG